MKMDGKNYKTNKSEHKIEVAIVNKDSPIYVNNQFSIMLLSLVE